MSSMTKVLKKQLQKLPPREKWNGWVKFDESSKIVHKGKETYAVFGSIAYRLNRIENDQGLILPGIQNGKVIGQFPEEGKSGLLHVYYLKKKKKWAANYIQCNWINTREIEQTNDEIGENITREILAGKNVITNRPPGWV